MLIEGFRESYNNIVRLPEIYKNAVLDIPRHMPSVVKMVALALIGTIPFGIYDNEFGRDMLNSFVMTPLSGLSKLILDPTNQLAILGWEIVKLVALAVACVAVGLLFGMVLGVVGAGVIGFARGVQQGYYKTVSLS